MKLGGLWRGHNAVSTTIGRHGARGYKWGTAVDTEGRMSVPQDVPQFQSDPPDCTLMVGTLANGIHVSSFDTGGSVSRLAIIIHSGSRHESDMKGITHLARNCALHTSGDRSTLRSIRELQATGGAFEVGHSREVITRTASFMRSHLQCVIENLAHDLIAPGHVEWDFADAVNYTKAENSMLATDPSTLNMELLHNVAFRTGLGNSLFCNDLDLSGVSIDDLQSFAESTYVGSKITVVGTDVDHDQLSKFVQEVMGGMDRGTATTAQPQLYHGGEVRNHSSVGLASSLLAGAAVGSFHEKNAVFAVLENVLAGVGGQLKWGSNASSRLNRSTQAGISDGNPLSVRAHNLAYSDAGLFGVQAVALPQDITKVLKSVVTELKAIARGDINQDDLERAKNQLIASLVMDLETKSSTMDDLTRQLVFTGTVKPLESMLSQVRNVTTDDIVATTTELLSGRLSLVSSGDVSMCPYLDELL